MKTSSLLPEDFGRSVMAVPPLARLPNLRLNHDANLRLMRYIEAGGVTTLLYGGNANFYNLPPSEFETTLDLLVASAARETWVIPAIGPDYGRIADQAAILARYSFPCAMLLPLEFPAAPGGVLTAVRRSVDRIGRPLILYLKSERFLSVADVGLLVDEERVCGVKYAIPRSVVGDDPFLSALVNRVDPRRIVSGFGEQAAVEHMRVFGLAGFTSGLACIAPHLSQQILAAARSGDFETADRLRMLFTPLEKLRDHLGPIAALHDAVSIAEIAPMGPMLPLLENIAADHLAALTSETKHLRTSPGLSAVAAANAR